MVAHTGLEPVISALRGQRVNQLHQCAVVKLDYRYRDSPSQVWSDQTLQAEESSAAYTDFTDSFYTSEDRSMYSRMGWRDLAPMLSKC